jgi:hypothetical protein
MPTGAVDASGCLSDAQHSVASAVEEVLALLDGWHVSRAGRVRAA